MRALARTSSAGTWSGFCSRICVQTSIGFVVGARRDEQPTRAAIRRVSAHSGDSIALLERPHREACVTRRRAMRVAVAIVHLGIVGALLEQLAQRLERAREIAVHVLELADLCSSGSRGPQPIDVTTTASSERRRRDATRRIGSRIEHGRAV